MNQKTLVPLLLVALLLWLGLNTFYVVDANQRAVIGRFGQVQATSFGAGIHARLPLVDHVIKVDKRAQFASLPALSLSLSNDQKAQLNAYVIWQVSDASRYVMAAKGRVGPEAIRQSVQEQLADSVNAALKTALAGADMTALVSGDHEAALAELQKQLAQSVSDKLGVEIRQLGLLNVNWPKDEQADVLARMQKSAGMAADQRLASTHEQVEQLKADADAKHTTLLADAYRQAQQIRADGDAKAGAIYANAYGKNPEFYRFWRSLEAYRNSFGSKRDVLVLGPDSEFFRYFREAGGKP